MRAQTDILLEDGRAVEAQLWSDPAREGLWFVDVDSFRKADDKPVVGPFASESDGRAYLFARIEREVGMIREVRRSVT